MTDKQIDLDNPEPGMYFQMSFETYVKIDAINNSTLKIFVDQSPAHAKYYRENGRESTQALAFGSLADCYILEPTLFFKKYVVGPDARGNSNVRRDFVASQPPEMTVIKPKDMEAVIAIYNKISLSPAMRLLSGGISQTVMIWKDEPTGLLCKSRQDYLNTSINLITDLKTTASAKPEHFSKDIFKYKYNMQAAFYIDGAIAITKEEEWSFAFFTVEKVEPYVSSAFQLGDMSIDVGRKMYRGALDLYAKCLEADSWPAYCEEIEMIDIPKWALESHGHGRYNA